VDFFGFAKLDPAACGLKVRTPEMEVGAPSTVMDGILGNLPSPDAESFSHSLPFVPRWPPSGARTTGPPAPPLYALRFLLGEREDGVPAFHL